MSRLVPILIVSVIANSSPGDIPEEPRTPSERRQEPDRARGAYRRASWFVVGAAAVSALACLVALAAAFVAVWRGTFLNWAAAIALVFAGITIAWKFVGRPLFPDDGAAYEMRMSALYAACISATLAVVAWIVGYWKRPSV